MIEPFLILTKHIVSRFHILWQKWYLDRSLFICYGRMHAIKFNWM